MKHQLCFIIDNQNLYLEQVLVDFNGYPIFYICTNEARTRHHFVLCADIDNMEYYVIQTTLNEISRVFSQKASISEIFFRKTFFWQVIAGETVEQDIVCKKEISQLDASALPAEGVKFEIFTDEIREYAAYIDRLLYENCTFDLLDTFSVRNGSVFDETENQCVEVDNYVKYIEILPLRAKISLPTEVDEPLAYRKPLEDDGQEVSLQINSSRTFDINMQNDDLYTHAA